MALYFWRPNCLIWAVFAAVSFFQQNSVCSLFFTVFFKDPVVSNNTELVGRVPCSMDCLKSDDYLDLLYTTISEFPGLAMTVFLVDILGRRKAVFYTLLVFAVITCLLNFCLSRFQFFWWSFFSLRETNSLLITFRTIMVIIFFVARCCIASTFQAIYIYTPEVIFDIKIELSTFSKLKMFQLLLSIIPRQFVQSVSELAVPWRV